jgi:class 3 adenylate cyclase
MSAYERATVVGQMAQRQALIDRDITEREGRRVQAAGNGLLVAFAKVVDTKACVAEV